MNDVLWITGASGFSGRHLAAFVRSLPDAPRIVGLDVRPSGLAHVDALHVVDLANADAVRHVATEAPPRWVIHLAGLMPPASEPDMWRANVGGTAGLLTGLRRAGGHMPRIVSIGSAAEYSPEACSPLREDSPASAASAYGSTKLAQSLFCLHVAGQFGFGAVIPRPFNLIGPGLPSQLVAASLVSQFVQAGREGTIRTGNTHTARDFVDVRDAVRAYWLLAVTEEAAGIFNVCSGTATKIADLLRLLAEVSGYSPRIETDPARVRSSDPVSVFGDPSRLRDTTGWRAEIPLEMSLRDMLVSA
jgi:GDP-4-dehydro-6-deoxy-D-mannose reductase